MSDPAERTTGASPRPRGAGDRVPRSHAQTRLTIRFVLGFLGAAALVAGWAVVRDWPDARWPVLHLLLAGAVTLAISGVSLMLTVTWATAPAPPDAWVHVQRTCVAVGALGVVVGRRSGAPDVLVGGAAALHGLGLVLLGALLVATARHGLKRRFDPAVAAYVVALTAAVTGGVLGAVTALGTPSVGVRSAHVVINLLGFVGLVIGGTLPFFASTVGRSKMAPVATPRRLLSILGWQAVAVASLAVLLTVGADEAAAGVVGAYALGVAAVLATMPRPERRQIEWSGPRLAALWLGGVWWIVALLGTAVDLLAGRGPFAGRWLLVLVVAGYVQILWGSLAYLLPVLRGGGHVMLGEGFAATRSWVGLVAVNVLGVALVGRWGPVAAVAALVWVLDAAARAARVGTRQAQRPDADLPDAAATDLG